MQSASNGRASPSPSSTPDGMAMPARPPKENQVSVPATIGRHDSRHTAGDAPSPSGPDVSAPSLLGPYRNVRLTDAALERLALEVPDWRGYVDRLSLFMQSTGRRYRDHEATIRAWALRDRPAVRSYDCSPDESL